MKLKRFFTTVVEQKTLISKIRAEPSLARALLKCIPDPREILEYTKKKLSEREEDFITCLLYTSPSPRDRS